jgi:hypothetical protein
MDYIDDPQEIEASLQALDRIKNWAYQQMGSMRRPGQQGPPETGQPAEGQVDEMNAPPAESMSLEMEQPLDEPPPPDFGQVAKKPDVEVEIITPARGAPPPKSPPPKDDDGMKKWTNETINKLDKFGRKPPRR